MSSHTDDGAYRRNRIVERIRTSRETPERLYSTADTTVLKLLQEYLYYKKSNANFDINAIKKEYYAFSRRGGVTPEKCLSNMLPYVWGLFPIPNKTKQVLGLIAKDVDPVFITDAFLRSVASTADASLAGNSIYTAGVGVIFDDLTCYYDATRPSRMELVLNSDLELTDKQKQRAKDAMQLLLSNKISKYNNQPEYVLDLGRHNAPKVLIVDQSYGDDSIAKGLADDTTFQRMLESAIQENPDADIVIKTHPDSLGYASLRPRCYYQHIRNEKNIYRLTIPANPISIIEQSDKVYVCSSQFGFEALMLGKEVHTFGMPFYAGWGLTIDAQQCPRRIRHRTLDDIFYIAYVMFSAYRNPTDGEQWEVEDAITFLNKNRKSYFKSRYK